MKSCKKLIGFTYITLCINTYMMTYMMAMEKEIDTTTTSSSSSPLSTVLSSISSYSSMTSSSNEITDPVKLIDNYCDELMKQKNQEEIQQILNVLFLREQMFEGFVTEQLAATIQRDIYSFDDAFNIIRQAEQNCFTSTSPYTQNFLKKFDSLIEHDELSFRTLCLFIRMRELLVEKQRHFFEFYEQLEQKTKTLLDELIDTKSQNTAQLDITMQPNNSKSPKALKKQKTRQSKLKSKESKITLSTAQGFLKLLINEIKTIAKNDTKRWTYGILLSPDYKKGKNNVTLILDALENTMSKLGIPNSILHDDTTQQTVYTGKPLCNLLAQNILKKINPSFINIINKIAHIYCHISVAFKDMIEASDKTRQILNDCSLADIYEDSASIKSMYSLLYRKLYAIANKQHRTILCDYYTKQELPQEIFLINTLLNTKNKTVIKLLKDIFNYHLQRIGHLLLIPVAQLLNNSSTIIAHHITQTAEKIFFEQWEVEKATPAIQSYINNDKELKTLNRTENIVFSNISPEEDQQEVLLFNTIDQRIQQSDYANTIKSLIFYRNLWNKLLNEDDSVRRTGRIFPKDVWAPLFFYYRNICKNALAVISTQKDHSSSSTKTIITPPSPEPKETVTTATSSLNNLTTQTTTVPQQSSCSSSETKQLQQQTPMYHKEPTTTTTSSSSTQPSIQTPKQAKRKHFNKCKQALYQLFNADQLVLEDKNHVVIKQTLNPYEQAYKTHNIDDFMTVVIYKTTAQTTLNPIIFRNYKSDKFHTISPLLKNYLCYGIIIDNKTFLHQYPNIPSFYLNSDTHYALVLHASVIIGNKHIAYHFQRNPDKLANLRTENWSGLHHGAYIFIFDKQTNECIHACFHEQS